MKFDFDQIRRDNPLPQVAAASGLALAPNGNEFEACCPFHAEKTPSFRIYQNKGPWTYHCFGCAAHGDVVDFVRERYGYDNNGDAARFLTGEDTRAPVSTAAYVEAHNPYEGYEITRPPADAVEILAGVRSPPLLNPKRISDTTGKPKHVTYTPSAVYPYRNKNGQLLGYVLRVEFDGRKITPGIWWTKCEASGFEGWAHGSYPSPRPLYGLDRLYANPDHQVLLVEGEKCADAACVYMEGKRVVPVTWMGGGKAIEKTYWKSIAGRSVIIWPDNDPEGWKTTLGYARPGGGWKPGLVELLYKAGAAKVKIVEITPSSRPEGWDIADALFVDKLDVRSVELLMRDRIREWTPKMAEDHKQAQIEKEMPHGVDRDGSRDGETAARDSGASNAARQDEARKPPRQGQISQDDRRGDDRSHDGAVVLERDREDDAPPPDEPAERPVGRGYEITEDTWRQHLIMKADGDGLKSTSLQNFTLILQYERRFAGVYAWNEFAKEVYLMRRPPWDMEGELNRWRPRKITEPDITATTSWMEYCGMSPKVSDMGRVIVRVADHNKYNPVVDAIDGLKWDGTPRVDAWLSYYLGADQTEANRMFGRRWLVGAIARAKEPGCKMDNMIILEGPQGLKKSSALRALSDGLVPHVFTDEMSDPNSKDAALQMQGAWIIEISELDSFKRAEVSQIKAWLARQTDRLRRPYGKIVEEFPRSCVFAGTVNPVGNSGYLKDPTGGRRFWPVMCKAIDLDALSKDARQLWAEAAAIYAAGERWWLTQEEEEVAFAVQSERYEDDPYSELIDNALTMTTETTMNTILGILEIPIQNRSVLVARRIEAHLSTRGWTKDKRPGGRVFYVRPKKEVLV